MSVNFNLNKNEEKPFPASWKAILGVLLSDLAYSKQYSCKVDPDTQQSVREGVGGSNAA
jgi:hypothetical protein